jgi:hypothetical protein
VGSIYLDTGSQAAFRVVFSEDELLHDFGDAIDNCELRFILLDRVEELLLE